MCLNKIKKFFHIHNYKKAIVSRYISFNTRDIIYECKCGVRKIIRTYREDSDDFPSKTTHLISVKDFKNYLTIKE